MNSLTVAGAILSALAFALLGYLLVDVLRRRGGFPSFNYGGRAVGQRTLALLWTGVLVIPFVISSVDSPRLASHTTYSTRPATGQEWTFLTSRTVTVPLPFYRYTTIENEGLVRDPGADERRVSTRAVEGVLQLPILFLLAAGLYWAVVMRWPVNDGRGRS